MRGGRIAFSAPPRNDCIGIEYYSVIHTATGQYGILIPTSKESRFWVSVPTPSGSWTNVPVTTSQPEAGGSWFEPNEIVD
jgi:hypothetical protein